MEVRNIGNVESCKLREQRFLPENQNEIHHISLFVSEILGSVGHLPISECRELPNWDKPIHLVRDPEIQKLFESHHRYGSKDYLRRMTQKCPFQAGEHKEKFVTLIGDDNLIATYEEVSISQRKILQSFFTSKRLENFKIIWKEIAGKWLESQVKCPQVLLFDASSKLISECLIKGILGYSQCSESDVELNANYWKTLFYPKSSERKSVKEYEEEGKPGFFENTRDFFFDMPEFSKKMYAFGIETKDLDCLIEKIYLSTKDKEGTLCHYLEEKKYTSETIFENIKGFLLAGQETVAHLLGFILYECAKNPELARHDLKKVYLETLRLYSVGGVVREAGRNMVLTYPDVEGNAKEHYIRKGDFIGCLPLLSGHDSSKWQEPEIFNPNRADIGNVTENPHFGSGPHRCIGEKTAAVEILTVLHEILSKSTLSTKEIMPDLLNVFTIRPMHDITVSFKERKL